MTVALALTPAQRAIVDRILGSHAPLARVWAFGSRARGTAKPFSDLDLAFDAGRAMTFEDLGALSSAFEESDLPWRVDIVDLATCSDTFRREIERDAVLILQR